MAGEQREADGNKPIGEVVEIGDVASTTGMIGRRNQDFKNSSRLV